MPKTNNDDINDKRKVEISDSCHARVWKIKGDLRVTMTEAFELALDAYDREQKKLGRNDG